MAAGLVIPQGTLFAGLSEVMLEFDSNVTAEENDLVNIQNGQIEIADAGERIAGYVAQDAAVTSSSENVPVNITPFMTVVMDSDETGDALAQDLVGEYVDITGGTGAQIVDISESTAPETTSGSGQLVILKQNDGDNWDAGAIRDDLSGDTSVGLFMIREAQFGLGDIQFIY